MSATHTYGRTGRPRSIRPDLRALSDRSGARYIRPDLGALSDRSGERYIRPDLRALLVRSRERRHLAGFGLCCGFFAFRAEVIGVLED
jgi:hypothetical protein